MFSSPPIFHGFLDHCSPNHDQQWSKNTDSCIRCQRTKWNTSYYKKVYIGHSPKLLKQRLGNKIDCCVFGRWHIVSSVSQLNCLCIVRIITIHNSWEPSLPNLLMTISQRRSNTRKRVKLTTMYPLPPPFWHFCTKKHKRVPPFFPIRDQIALKDSKFSPTFLFHFPGKSPNNQTTHTKHNKFSNLPNPNTIQKTQQSPYNQTKQNSLTIHFSIYLWHKPRTILGAEEA